MAGHLALILHAHLPYVRHPEHLRSLEERWLYEALWESYLPLLDVFDRLAADGIPFALTFSVSPPLAAMLADDLLRARFVEHMNRLERLADHVHDPIDARLRPALAFTRRRLADMRRVWSRIDGDLLAALRVHERAGRVELITSAATHAYLPGLLASPASIRAQLRLGLRGFESIVGVRPRGLWLPECAYDPRLGPDLAAAGVRYTVVDAHGIELASPRPVAGIVAPVLSRSGVAFFARDPDAAQDVWSRQVGYPGDPWYREFYRDVGFDLPEAELLGEVGPHGTRLMTGLKLYRITAAGEHKEPYDPEAAFSRARAHARLFVETRAAAATRTRCLQPIWVAPFDAELFGHWWFEGPSFIEHVFRELYAARAPEGLSATTLGGYLARFPRLTVAEPAASTWGEGGFGAVWAGPEAALLWRHVHHTARRVQAILGTRRLASGLAGRALDQSIRELLLLQSSDWAFMMHRGEMAAYAEARVREHVHRITKLVDLVLADEVPPEDEAWLECVCAQDRFLAEIAGPALRDALDPW